MKLHQKIIGTFCAYLIGFINQTFAAPLTGTDTIISKPVGSGILPGGGSEGTDIQSSVLFAKIIPFLIKWGINLAIGLAVLFMIYGGYQMLTSYGDEEKNTNGMRTLIYAAIGLILSITAYAIVTIITRIEFS